MNYGSGQFEPGPDARRGRGGARRGAGRKPNEINALRELLKGDGEAALDTLVELMTTCSDDMVRFQAAKTILEHVVGRPRAAVAIEAADEPSEEELCEEYVRHLLNVGREAEIPPTLHYLIERVREG